MIEFGKDIEADLHLIDVRLKQLKLEYEQYFLGTRKREPLQTRSELQKYVQLYAQSPIKNTGYRFKFNNLRSRFFTYRRHWDETLRKIEEGRYERHAFRANLKERERNDALERRNTASQKRAALEDRDDLYEAYIAARQATGQGTQDVSRDKLDALLMRQETQIRKKYGAEKVRFKVVVEDGKAKLKATAIRS